MYLIWSFEHNAWWRENRCGYTEQIDEAGRYDKFATGEIVTSSVLCEECAVYEPLALRDGPPKFHPYVGAKRYSRY